MNSKSYLLTGGCGFIGAALTRRLVREGHSVRVLDNQSRGSAERLAGISGQIEFIEADVRDTEAVKKAARGVTTVCHLAFINGTEFFYSKPELVLDVGVKGMINVIDACLDNGIKELALCSSSEVYQTPAEIPTGETVPLVIPDLLNPRYSYAAGKIISEMMTVNYGRRSFERVTIFRPHNVYGPDMGWEHVIPQFVVRMKELSSAGTDTVRFPIQGDGSQTRSFVYIDDFIDGVMLVLEKGEHMGIYHIGTMEEVSVADLAAMVGEYFGKAIELVPGELAKGGTPRRCPDIARISQLGYSPKYSLREGLNITAGWYDENAGKAKDARLE